jgi:hypothetical protein
MTTSIFQQEPLAMKSSTGLLVICLAAAIVGAPAAQAATLTPLASFGGGDGNLAPGDRAYLTADNLQRGLAYNPATGHLLLVNRSGGLSVQILDGTTGDDIGTLDLTDVSGGLFPGNMIAIADDGAIYMGNLTTVAGTNGNFKVYRWENEASAPTVAFDDVPLAGARMGDSLDVFGSGSNTRIAAGYGASPVVAGNNSFALLTTTDGSNFSGTHIDIPTIPPNAGDFRLGITFQDADTVIGRQSAAPPNRIARIVDVSGSTGTLVADYATEGNAYIGVDFATVDGKPLIALVNTANSATAVYDITPPFEMVDPNPNIAVANASSTTNPNVNGTGQARFGAISGNTAILYAINTNNGIQAYTLTLTEPAGDTADFDGDGDVDGADFLAWQRGNGAVGTGTTATGDANGDMNVDAADLAVWQAQFAMPQSPIAAVPEPTGVVLGLLALALGAARCRV